MDKVAGFAERRFPARTGQRDRVSGEALDLVADERRRARDRDTPRGVGRGFAQRVALELHASTRDQRVRLEVARADGSRLGDRFV